MSTSNSLQQLSIEEQIQQAERKYQQLLQDDAQFKVLKQIKDKIKILREQLNLQQGELKKNL